MHILYLYATEQYLMYEHTRVNVQTRLTRVLRLMFGRMYIRNALDANSERRKKIRVIGQQTSQERTHFEVNTWTVEKRKKIDGKKWR